LEPDRKTDQVSRQIRARILRRVRGPRRVDRKREALEAAPRDADREDLERIAKRARVAPRDEGEKPARSFELRPPKRVTGIARKRGVKDAFDARVSFEPSSDLESASRVTLHPNRQGPQSADRERGIGGRKRRAEERCHPANTRDRFGASRREPEDDIRVAGDVLRPRMEDEVDPELERTLIERRRPGIVHYRNDATLARDPPRLPKIDHLEREARRRLEIEKPRRRPDVIAESCKLAHAEKGDFDAEARQHVAREDARRTVRARLKDPVISAREVRKKRRRDRAHSRRE